MLVFERIIYLHYVQGRGRGEQFPAVGRSAAKIFLYPHCAPQHVGQVPKVWLTAQKRKKKKGRKEEK